MDNTITRLQSMITDAGFSPAILALSAAKAGDFAILRQLRQAFGSEIFLYGDSSLLRSAYEQAASANRVDVMQWLSSEEGWMPLSSYVAMNNKYKNEGFKCPLAFVAANHGSLDALEYIAAQVPELRTQKIRTSQMEVDIEEAKAGGGTKMTRFAITNFSQNQDACVSYAGLLVSCALVTQIAGGDDARILTRLKEHLAEGHPVAWHDLNIALRFDQQDMAEMLLEAGAKIDMRHFFTHLKSYRAPVRALATLADYLERNGKSFDDIALPYQDVAPNGALVNIACLNDVLSLSNAFVPILHNALKVVEEINNEVRQEYRAPSCDHEQLASQMVRFMAALGKEFTGCTMLRTAVRMWNRDLVKALLESGVDPNAYQEKGDHPSDAGKLPVHGCRNADILRTLHAYGADVNLPLRGNEDVNLLQILCTEIGIDDDMLYAFAECGGDFARKFDGKTAASLAKKKGEAFHAVFMAAKTGIAVTKSLDVQVENAPAKSSRSLKSGPL